MSCISRAVGSRSYTHLAFEVDVRVCVCVSSSRLVQGNPGSLHEPRVEVLGR